MFFFFSFKKHWSICNFLDKFLVPFINQLTSPTDCCFVFISSFKKFHEFLSKNQKRAKKKKTSASQMGAFPLFGSMKCELTDILWWYGEAFSSSSLFEVTLARFYDESFKQICSSFLQCFIKFPKKVQSPRLTWTPIIGTLSLGTRIVCWNGVGS